MNTSKSRATNSFSFSSLALFMLIAFGLAWGIVGLYIFLPGIMVGWFGELTGQHPLFYLAVYSPAIAALTIVFTRTRWNGTRQFLSRLLLWRAPKLWYVFLIVVIPILFYIGADMKGLESSELIPVTSVGSYLILLALSAIKGPVEEIGWRGFALPMLQRKMSPLSASIVLGVIWAVWHFPAFLLSGTQQSSWSFTAFFVGTLALSTITTALFNASRGSILLPALLHWQLINPLWPDAQPYDTLPFVVAAVVIVWLNRERMLPKDGGITEILGPSRIIAVDSVGSVSGHQPESIESYSETHDASPSYNVLER